MESINVVNIQMGHKSTDTDNDDMKMDVSDEQENRCDTISTEGRKTSVLTSDRERDMQGHSQLVDEDAIILATNAEGQGPEKHRLEGIHSTDIRSDGKEQKEEIHTSQSSQNGARSKKLKTDQEDPITRIRNRSRSRTRNT